MKLDNLVIGVVTASAVHGSDRSSIMPDFSPIIPKFNISFGTQIAFLDELSLLLHDVFERDALVRENLQSSAYFLAVYL